MEMTKREILFSVLGVIISIVTLFTMVDGIKYIVKRGRERNKQSTTIEELVDKLQTQLPIVNEYKSCVITQTGLEIKHDTLVSIYQIEAADSILLHFRKPTTLSQIRDDGLQGIISDYKAYLLIRMACDSRMIISNRFSEQDGTPVVYLDYTPNDYLPLLNKE